MSARRCFKCQGLRHIAVNCPNRMVITLVEWKAMKEEEKDVEPEEELEGDKERSKEECLAEPDKGETLLRRVLSNQRSEKNDQRENIFHSRYTVEGKVSSLIIDGGSCANVISDNMVEKLNLQTSTHSPPYNIQWLNQK